MKRPIIRQLLSVMASLVLFVATASVHVPCTLNYYQPVVPARLRRD